MLHSAASYTVASYTVLLPTQLLPTQCSFLHSAASSTVASYTGLLPTQLLPVGFVAPVLPHSLLHSLQHLAAALGQGGEAPLLAVSLHQYSQLQLRGSVHSTTWFCCCLVSLLTCKYERIVCQMRLYDSQSQSSPGGHRASSPGGHRASSPGGHSLRSQQHSMIEYNDDDQSDDSRCAAVRVGVCFWRSPMAHGTD